MEAKGRRNVRQQVLHELQMVGLDWLAARRKGWRDWTETDAFACSSGSKLLRDLLLSIFLQFMLKHSLQIVSNHPPIVEKS